jgi:hypothetical protein
MFIGAIFCAILSVSVIYQVVITQKTTYEWLIWIFVILGFILLSAGYLTERKYKRKHPGEFEATSNEITEDS